MAPLAGIVAVELGHSVAAPYARQILGDLDAEVVKIEKPEGDDARKWGPPFVDGAAATFQALNRNERAVGERRAKELILAARAIAENAPLSARQAKKSIHYGLQTDIATGYRFEIEAYNRLVTTEDRIEGVRAFNEKRKPVFHGR